MTRMVRRASCDRGDDSDGVAAHERDGAGFHGHVGSTAHRDSNIGLGERGSVVQSVADHRHDASTVLNRPDLLELPIGQYLGHHTTHADGPGHALRRPAVVAGQHDCLDPHLLECRHRDPAAGLDRIGDGDEPGDPPIHGDQYRRVAIGRAAAAAVDSVVSIRTRRSCMSATLPTPTR